MHRHHLSHSHSDAHGERERCRHRGFGRHEGSRDHAGPFAGGGRRPRMFDQGDLRLVILQLVQEKPSHGYEIIKAVEDRLAGAYSPSPGVVYPTLTLLEETGLVSLADGPGGRKLYTITDEGRAALARERSTVDAIFARMADISAVQGRGPAPQLIRAFENLKTALKLRTARGDLSEAQIAEIAALLDGAASAVERS